MTLDRDRWTQWVSALAADGLRVPVTVPKRPKYGALPVLVDGLGFDSQREAARYQELKLLLAAGLIRALEIHPVFPLMVVALYRDGPPWTVETIGKYTADFRYEDLRTGEIMVEDVKSEPTKTTAYKQRKRHVEAQYGITVTEVA